MFHESWSEQDASASNKLYDAVLFLLSASWNTHFYKHTFIRHKAFSVWVNATDIHLCICMSRACRCKPQFKCTNSKEIQALFSPCSPVSPLSPSFTWSARPGPAVLLNRPCSVSQPLVSRCYKTQLRESLSALRLFLLLARIREPVTKAICRRLRNCSVYGLYLVRVSSLC